MRTIFIIASLSLLATGCTKVKKVLDEKSNTIPTGQFIQYTIRQGQQYCDQSTYRPVETSEMKFVVRFDSSAIYQSQAAENQFDINKLYGFADNGANHQQYSARIGWRWSDNALRLFAYVYNAGVVRSKEISSISIGSEVNCSIKISEGQYIFTVSDHTEQMPRSATTQKGTGYQLFPYFGGNEAAPHEIKIWIKEI